MFDELGDGVFRRRYESLDLNVGVILGDDGVLIVDTRAFHRQADELKDDLKTLTELSVRWVANTHWHWDHVFGNSRFPQADIWGHELCRKALVERGEGMKQGAKRWLSEEWHGAIDEVEIVPPHLTFSRTASINIGRGVEMRYLGLGHTDADIVIGVPDADVTFMGDLIEEGAPPAFGDAYPLSWPLTVRLAMESLSEPIVPGHGDVVDLGFIRAQHEELVAVAELATSCIEGETNVEDAAARGPYPVEVMTMALERAMAVV